MSAGRYAAHRPSLLPILTPLCLRGHSVKGYEALLDQLRQALEQGANPNGWYRDVQDFTALGAIAVAVSRPGSSDQEQLLRRKFLFRAAEILFEHGANPLSDRANVFAMINSEFSGQIIDRMAQTENSAPMRDCNGQCLLHVLMKDRIYPLKYGHLPEAWFNAQRKSDQATPFHLLWEHHEYFASDEASKLRPHSQVLTQFMNLWEQSSHFAKQGARVDIPNSAGMKMSDIILGKVQEGLTVLDGAKPLISLCEAVRLQETVPTSRAASSRRI